MSVVLYSTCSPILPGCTLTDGYGGFMPDGYYSNGVNWVIVSGGLGVITSYGSCTPPPTTTTTSTSTTTTAAPPPPGTVYILSDVGCSGITTLYVTGNINPVVGKYYKPTSVTGSAVFNGSTCFECIGTIVDTAVYTDLVFGYEFTDCSCTTTTTTVAPLTAHTLYYSSVSAADACSTTNSITVYTNCDPIISGCEFWYDAAGTVVAGEYFYSDHATNTVYEMYVNHFFGTGVVASVSSCTTTTSTTTTTINPNGDFRLDPQYGINITALAAATGTLPAFTFPRNSGSSQTLKMVSSYSAGNQFVVTLSGTRFPVGNKKVTLYVNSVVKAQQTITADGAQTKTLTCATLINATDNVTIAIDS
jgi:hypothetical protein